MLPREKPNFKYMADHVILVDKNDNEIGTEEKILAHQKKLLHRAFSIFLFINKYFFFQFNWKKPTRL